MSTIVEAIKKLHRNLLVIIGGPPVSEEAARKMGADLYAEDAYAGVEIIRRAIGTGAGSGHA
jgi:methanogenic corrinoid protein MtbC1